MISQDELDYALNERAKDLYYRDDCETIARLAYERHSLLITSLDANRIWEEYSDSMAARWLIVTPEGVTEAIETFIVRRRKETEDE